MARNLFLVVDVGKTNAKLVAAPCARPRRSARARTSPARSAAPMC